MYAQANPYRGHRPVARAGGKSGENHFFMQLRIENQQVRPFYISASEEVNAGWSDNFAQHIGSMAARLGIPEELVTKIDDNNKGLQKTMLFNRDIEEWLAQWRIAKRALFTGRPQNPDQPVPFPATPTFPTLPSATYAYVLAPHIQAANIVLANPLTTEADRQLLRLVRADGLPTPPEAANRVKADEYNYPLLKVRVLNNQVIIICTRGNRWRGKAILLQVDRQGKGEYQPLVNTTNRSYSELISLPPDVQSAAWVYRAIYVEGTTTISDWSPDLGVVVRQEASPFQV